MPEQRRKKLATQYGRGYGPVVRRTIRAMLDRAAQQQQDLPDLTVLTISSHHGHLTFTCRASPDVWLYASDGTPVSSEERPCPHCRLLPHPEGPDGCLGMLPGVCGACCGHGGYGGTFPYVRFSEEGLRDAVIQERLNHARQGGTLLMNEALHRDDALRYFHDQGVGPSFYER